MELIGTGPAKRTVLNSDDEDNDPGGRTELPTKNARTSTAQKRNARISSSTATSAIEPVRSSSVWDGDWQGDGALHGSATADPQDPPNLAMRPSNETLKRARSNHTLQEPTKTDPEISPPSKRSILSPLSSRLANIKFPNFEKCAQFIELRDPDDFNNYNDFLQEAISAYRSGDFDYTRSCIQASLLLRESAIISPGQASELFSDLSSDRESALSDVMDNFGKVLEFVKAKAIDKKPFSAVTRLDRRTGLESRGLVYGLETTSTPGIGQQGHPRPSRHMDPKVERLSTGPTSAHSKDVTQSHSSPKRKESQWFASSTKSEDIEIRSPPSRSETLDPRYRMQKNPAEFFIVGRVFALLWHENLGIGNAARDRRPQDAYTSKDRFGEQVFSHTLRMVVVRPLYGYSWCTSIDTYGGRGLAKRGFTPQLIQAHAVVYDAAGTPYKASGEPESPCHPIAIRLSPDQQLDKMSRLNFSKVHTVQWDVKVMNIGKVTDSSLLHLEAQWAKETAGGYEEGTAERHRKDSSTPEVSSHPSTLSLPVMSGQDPTSLEDNTSKDFRNSRGDVLRTFDPPSPAESEGSGFPLATTNTSSVQVCLSQLAFAFTQIGVIDFKNCRKFIQEQPAILKEDDRHFRCQAALAYDIGNKQYARACVHRSLMVSKCSKLDAGELEEYLRHLTGESKSALKHFMSDLDATYEHTKANIRPLMVAGHRLVQQSTPRGQTVHSNFAGEQSNTSVRRPSTNSRHIATSPDINENFRDFSITGGVDDRYQPPRVAEPASDRRHRPQGSINSRGGSGYQGSHASVGPGEYKFRGTPGDLETLDPRYKRQKDPARFFCVGKVFAILWHENVGQSNREPGPDVIISEGRFGERIFSYIRRMIVIRDRYGYCWCVGIHTYGKRGIAGKRMSLAEAKAHAVAHDSKEDAQHLEGEEAIGKEPIAIDMIPGHTLETASRLNFAEVFTVEHNVKVMPLGRVALGSLPYLRAYWANESSG